jgi:hypothetical protein
MTTDARPRSPRGRLGATAAIFAALAALTITELQVARLDVPGPGRATALAALLLGKVAIVLVYCLRADFRRRAASRLALIALFTAAVFAAVLMLEAAFQARVR